MAAFPRSAVAFALQPVRVHASSTADREDCRADRPRARDNEHSRRAIEVMLRSLAWLPGTEEVCRLREQGESLLAQVEGWSREAPSPEIRERVMRRVASLHLGAVSAMRAARERR